MVIKYSVFFAGNSELNIVTRLFKIQIAALALDALALYQD
jgi:hypothetical protein